MDFCIRMEEDMHLPVTTYEAIIEDEKEEMDIVCPPSIEAQTLARLNQGGQCHQLRAVTWRGVSSLHKQVVAFDTHLPFLPLFLDVKPLKGL